MSQSCKLAYDALKRVAQLSHPKQRYRLSMLQLKLPNRVIRHQVKDQVTA